MSTFEHIWTCFEQVWTYFNTFEKVLKKFEHNWTYLNALERGTSHLNKFELDTFQHIWTNLNKFEQVWTHLKKFWTSLNTIEHIWTRAVESDFKKSNKSRMIFIPFSDFIRFLTWGEPLLLWSFQDASHLCRTSGSRVISV